MPTTICFDFGNTRLKAGIFSGKLFLEEVVLPGSGAEDLRPLMEKVRPEKTILSSVINHPAETNELLAQFGRFHLLNHASQLPITTPVGKPETIGADRLAICSAAVDLFPRRHCLVIGLGTCITYNFINAEHEFLGGSISPGMNMRFRAMHEQTALLPMAKPTKRFPLVGYDTMTNLQSGVIQGMAAEIDGIIHAYRSKYNELQVLITGGDLFFFDSLLLHPMHRDPYLLFRGLHAICQANLPDED
ncbi:MAG: type III pantothenate kinase [Chitinophagaceae bacterium]|jgi:type III pantothenate kinase|nr:type III pantothenate kinase [Chitinophagaceae bacterium]MCE2972111.1 type III pantothenate kinase [Sediminibacterium sp.]MCA6475602.1 type III pantothenate kinase [Chitinophagaceae bacterium]MCA6484154.1 type III pantothenate kinase [Chitinophagaceae bacterium]MCA6495367.1 type III pantothenate kinase [Chitinophagaceae bacterium]